MKKLLTLVTAAALSACVSKYHPMGSNGGYADTYMGSAQHKVHYAGRVDQAPYEVRDFALLRAAEITLASGMASFDITQERSEIEETERHEPLVASRTSDANRERSRKDETTSETMHKESQYQVSGGYTVIEKTPHTYLTIQMYPRSTKGAMYDAQSMYTSLRIKHNIEDK